MLRCEFPDRRSTCRAVVYNLRMAEAPLVGPLADEVARLRRCLNDLIGLLALTDGTSSSEPSDLVSDLMEELLRRLGLAFVALDDPAGGITEVKIAEPLAATTLARGIGEALDLALGNAPAKWPSTGRVLSGDRWFSVATVPLGLHGEIGILAAGSQKIDFPDQTERLLLDVATCHASMELLKARRVGDGRLVGAPNQELRNALDEIQKSEAKLRQVIDTIPTLAWCNLPEGPNEFLNKGWHEYTGLPPDESHGWGWQVAFHPDDLPSLMERWGELLISGDPGEIEARLRRHDGAYRWFLIRVEPFRDDSGKIVRWYGTSTDIDDRKRVEEQLRRSEAFLAEGQRLSRTGTFWWRVDTNDIAWSAELYRIFDSDPGVPVTLAQIGMRVHPEDLELFDDMIERARRGESHFEYEHRLLMPDGSVKHLHLIAHGTQDHQNRLEYFGAVQDVTQRRASDEALSRARSELAHMARIMSLSALTASIAHEVNQPLSGIVTNASTCLRLLAADPPDVERARETAR